MYVPITYKVIKMSNIPHDENRNLTIYQGTRYNGMPLLPKYTYIAEYLAKIELVLNNAQTEHPRTLAIRFDLHMPKKPNDLDYPYSYTNDVISTFIASLKAKFTADLERKSRGNIRLHPSTFRYIWVKELSITGLPHYHVVIFLNNDTYNSIGPYSIQRRNNFSRIVESWASALKSDSWPILLERSFEEACELVSFPKDTPMYYVNANHIDHHQLYFNLFKRLSYFAKNETKDYTNGQNIGYSRK